MLYKILVFESTHWVMKAERCLIELHQPLTVIPTPKDLSSDCGIALRIEAAEFNEPLIRQCLEKEKMFCKIFEREMI